MNDRIYLSSPDVTQVEEDAVLDAIRSGWIAPLGPEVNAFEAEIAAFTGRAHAVALSSGTAALHLALLQLGATAGTVVVTASMTFAATANAVVYTGAEPVFVDCDATGNMDVDLLETALMDLTARGARIAAILPVDLLGKVADYPGICELAERFGIPVLADAAESLGAVRDGVPAGKAGVAAAISFNGNKIMTTSGGGMLVTDEVAIAERARYLATQARQPVVHYEHIDVGYNYRLSNLLAGLGRAQLSRLPAMIERRRGWRLAYRELFAGARGATIFGGDDGATAPASADHDNFWLTSVLVDEETAGWSARGLQEHLATHDIEARPLWKPMHMQPVFSASERYTNGVSEAMFRSGISLPSGSALTQAEFERVVEAIGSYIQLRTA